MMDEASKNTIIRMLEYDLENKKCAIMSAVESNRDDILQQQVWNYRVVLHAKEEFTRHVGSGKTVKA